MAAPARRAEEYPDDDRPGAAHWVPARPTLARIHDAAQACRGCELYREATQAVTGTGPATASLMLIGEQPGDREDVEGEPFVGPAGRVLERALAGAGIDPAGVYLTNAVKHFRWRPAPRGKRRIHQKPGRTHVEACHPWLIAELNVVRPAGVVLLGSTAAQAVYGTSFKITQSRGEVLEWPDDPALKSRPGWALATTHPSAILRVEQRDEAFAALVADLKVAAGQLVQ